MYLQFVVLLIGITMICAAPSPLPVPAPKPSPNPQLLAYGYGYPYYNSYYSSPYYAYGNDVTKINTGYESLFLLQDMVTRLRITYTNIGV